MRQSDSSPPEISRQHGPGIVYKLYLPQNFGRIQIASMRAMFETEQNLWKKISCSSLKQPFVFARLIL